ncbi:MAG: selenocysteine-specific translation elongation factor [Chloroflexota bacterium]
MTVVVGTAGHIDHGKTTLLRALTGIDADRLPEERRRGMTIEVGYAHLAFDDGRVVDFVDVPGHEKLVGNMLVGAGEIDAVLLVVAADDGPRAQTVEHLGLLDALGLSHAVVALTKIDVLRGDWGRLAAGREALRALVDRSSLAGSPIVAVSGTTGEGLDELRRELRTLVDRVAGRTGSGQAVSEHPARLAVDRVFSMKGRGTVVTGSLRGGPLEVGDLLDVRPGRWRMRVRELQVHNARVERIEGGGRAALNVVGPGADRLSRGALLTADPAVAVTRRLLVRLHPPFDGAPGAAWPPAANAPLRVFIGTDRADADVGRGRTDGTTLDDGTQVATLRLASPMAVAAGDRLVLRRPAPIGTVAGGVVLDPSSPTGPSRKRMTPERLVALAAAAASDADRGAVAAARLALHGALPSVGRGGWLLASDVADLLGSDAIAIVEAAPAGLGHAELRGDLARGLRRRVAIPIAAAEIVATDLIAGAIAAGHLARDGDLVHLPGRAAAGPSPDMLAAMDRLESLLAVPAPPSLGDAARAAGCPPDGIRALESAGRITRLEDDLAWATSTYRDLEAEALRLARTGPLAPAALRDATGTSRKYVMALLEDFDRRGILRRTQAGHVPGPRAPR